MTALKREVEALVYPVVLKSEFRFHPAHEPPTPDSLIGAEDVEQSQLLSMVRVNEVAIQRMLQRMNPRPTQSPWLRRRRQPPSSLCSRLLPSGHGHSVS